MPENDVANNVAAHQFETRVDGQLALLAYSERDGVIDMKHTEVPPALEGHGVGNDLAKAALEYAREKHLRVIPTCPFVRSYIRRHPQYADLTKVARE